AFGPEDHDQHERKTEQQHADAFGVEDDVAKQRLLQGYHDGAQQFREHRQQQCPQDHPGDIAHAAQHHHAQHGNGFSEAEAFGADETLHGSKHAASDTAERCPHGKGQQLDVAGVDAHGLGRDLVFTNRFPGTADTRMLQARADDDDDDGEEQQQVIVLFGTCYSETEEFLRAPEHEIAHLEGVDAIDALRAVGDVDRRIEVVQEDAHDLAKAQGDDRQIVAPQL